MPVAPLSPSDFLHLRSATWGEEALSDYFRARPNSDALDAWLHAQLRDGTPRSQLLLRTARASHSFSQTPGGDLRLLIGLPAVLGESSLSAVDCFKAAQIELEAGLSHALRWSVTFWPHPVAADELRKAGATGWAKIARSFNAPPPEQEAWRGVVPDAATEGPAVWVGEVRAPSSDRTRVGQLLFQTNAQVSDASRSLLMRAEGLLEESALRCRLLPPTALWNAPSIARLVHLRMWLAALPATAWSLSWQQGELLASGPQRSRKFEFPEELAGDLEPVLAWFHERTNLVP
jgi:hypothetical protein